MEWLLWLLLYPAGILPVWIILSRWEYRDCVRDPMAHLYKAVVVSNAGFRFSAPVNRISELSDLSEEDQERVERTRLELCRKAAVLGSLGAAALWPVAVIAAPFAGVYLAVKWLATMGIDRELEREKEFKKAQKIVDEWNARKKLEEDRAWAEALNE